MRYVQRPRTEKKLFHSSVIAHASLGRLKKKFFGIQGVPIMHTSLFKVNNSESRFQKKKVQNSSRQIFSRLSLTAECDCRLVMRVCVTWSVLHFLSCYLTLHNRLML